MLTVDQVEAIAREAHAQQCDKNGRPYSEHLEAVARGTADRGGDADQVAAAWLHDALEDGVLSEEWLAGAELSERTKTIVRAMTRRDGEPLEVYLARVRATPGAAVVKAADLAHNSDPARLALIQDPEVRERLRAKYARTRDLLFPEGPHDVTGTGITGSFLELDGRPTVRFSREYDNPVEQVWALVATPHGLAAWFPAPQVRLDPVAGGTIRFSGDPHMPESQGTVRAAEPGRLLAFTWGDDELRFELTELGPDRTRLLLVDMLDSADAAARNGAGWELCLRALDARAAGEPAPAPQPDAWLPLYRAYQAAGFPSGAPVPGLDE